MRTVSIAVCAAFLLFRGAAYAGQMFAPFVDEDGPNMLAWDTETGKSKLFVFSGGWTPWDDDKQLPQNPVEAQPGDRLLFAPYVDKEGKDNALVWSVNTGKSKLFIFDGGQWVAWDDDKQIPEAPLGKAEYHFQAYRDKAGNDNVLVSDSGSGRCIFFVYENGVMAPWAKEKQPPQNPLGFEPGAGTTHMAPYADEDGDNLLVYDPATGRSKLFLYGGDEWSPWDADKQLPGAPVALKEGEKAMLLPYVDLEGDNNIMAVNLSTGSSKFYIFDDGWSAWDDDKQLTAEPLKDAGGKGLRFAPFVDDDGDSLLVFEPETGRSKLYLLGGEGWSEWDADKQMPQNPLGK